MRLATFLCCNQCQNCTVYNHSAPKKILGYLKASLITVNSHKGWSFTVTLYSQFPPPPLFHEPFPTPLSSSFHFPSGKPDSHTILSHKLQLLNPPWSSPLIRVTSFLLMLSKGWIKSNARLVVQLHCWSEKSSQSKQQMKHAQRHITAAFKRKHILFRKTQTSKDKRERCMIMQGTISIHRSYLWSIYDIFQTF